jgi:two-component system KDP operon response regulator KdpE
VLLDLGLPDLDGMDVLKIIRAESHVPVIVISARGQEEAKITALDAGADDYLEKPFGVGELLARLRAALRHRNAPGGVSGSECAHFKGLRIDTFRRLAYVDENPLVLTPKEWGLLLLFADNAGRVLTHKQILKAVWGSANMSNIQYLRVYVGQLRQKLGPAGCLISTETGIGYRMADRSQPDRSESLVGGRN